MGPLGVGTLVVKPFRHCLHVAELSDHEVEELGPLLREVARCVEQLCDADQTYICLWSHAGWQPVHIHFIVQPALNADRGRFSAPGPSLQAAMFSCGEQPALEQVLGFCERARGFFRLGREGDV